MKLLDKTILIRLPFRLQKQIKRVAHRQGLSVSAWIRRVLSDAVAETEQSDQIQDELTKASRMQDQPEHIKRRSIRRLEA